LNLQLLRYLPLRATLLAMVLAATLSLSSFADAPSSIVLPAKSLVLVVVVNHLKSGDVHVGDAVRYRTVTNTYGPNHELLIPAGAEGHGRVTKSDKAGMAGKSGKLGFTCDYVLASDNTHIAFADADLSKAGRSYNAVTLALIAGPLALFGKGKNIDVNEGTPLVMAVGADTPVVPLATIPPDQTVTVVPDKHHGKKMTGMIKAFDTDTLTVVSDGMDKVMKLKDIKQILLSDSLPGK